jgi:hypothetical protein
VLSYIVGSSFYGSYYLIDLPLKSASAFIEQNERMEELRDIHRLEGVSRSAQVDKLEKQQGESNVLLAATESKLSSTSTELERVRAENSAIRAEFDKERQTAKEDEDKLRIELEKVQRTAKDEEEKRTKAISLLKTVRLKSVKTEKDLDEVMQERALFRGEVAKERDAHKAELAKLESEVEKIRIDKGKDLARLKAQFDAELAAVKHRLEKEAATQKSQFELDAINLKVCIPLHMPVVLMLNDSLQATNIQELTSKSNRISQLEASLQSLSQERDSLFDQLQLRQAEVESSQYHLESLENQSAELRHLLREATDRASALSDELLDTQRQVGAASANGSDHGATAAKNIVAEVEKRYESKISDLRQRMMILEGERSDAEEEWSRNLAERSKEIDRLRSELAAKDGLQSAEMGQKAVTEELVHSLQAELQTAKDEKQAMGKELALSKAAFEQAKETEVRLSFPVTIDSPAESLIHQNLIRLEHAQYVQRVSLLEKEMGDVQNREVLLRGSNKVT